MQRPKITPFLWFDQQAEEAANLYVSLFPDSKVGKITRAPAGGPAPAGSVLVVEFQLAGCAIIGLNGGPMYQFTEAVSFSIDCADQAEVDHYWNGLTLGGTAGRCGWLKDKFGLSWQVVPRALSDLMSSPDPARAGRVMAALMTMQKIDVAALENAARGD